MLHQSKKMIKDILAKGTEFEGISEIDRFSTAFRNIYKSTILRPSLDLALTEVQKKHLTFEIKIIKDWDTNFGCYLSEQRKFYNKYIGSWVHKKQSKIILRNLTPSLIAHETAHATEVESGVTLGNEFRQAIGLDMKGRMPKNVAFAAKFKRIIIDGIKPYPQNQVISELFARFFEIIAESRPISPNSAFTEEEVKDFFINSSNWLSKIFNPKLQSKIDSKIQNQTKNLQFDDKKYNLFAHKINSFHKRTDSAGKKTWAANVKSNAAWHESWKNSQKKIED